VQAPRRKGGIVSAFAASGVWPRPERTRGRKILNAVAGMEERMFRKRRNQIFVSVKARKMSVRVSAGSPPTVAVGVGRGGLARRGFERRWRREEAEVDSDSESESESESETGV
jgi:hypothetical protein